MLGAGHGRVLAYRHVGVVDELLRCHPLLRVHYKHLVDKRHSFFADVLRE